MAEMNNQNNTPYNAPQYDPNSPTKKCKHCQSDIPAKAKVCPVCRKRQGMPMGCLIPLIIVGVFILLVVVGAIGRGGRKSNTTSTTNTTVSETASSVDTGETNEAETHGETEPAVEETYESNSNFDITEKGSYTNSLGYTVMIHKVSAKKDVTMDATAIAYDKDENVIGKSSDSIVLTEGKTNYFRFNFDADVSDATIEISTKTSSSSILEGERNAVEMTKYNISGNSLYITVEQTGEEVGGFAKYKLLYYKGDEIVGDESGYFTIGSENLNGKGSTDVIEVHVYGKDFDTIEYIFEP